MGRVALIARKAASHGLGFLISRIELERHLPAWLRLPRGGEEVPPEDLPARLASVLEELGPTFVKFGQMLATRPDILPPAYVHELERICHHVAPFSSEVSCGIIREELGAPAEEIFGEFSEEPLASGSMAQVHAATLQDGTPVVVKVRRPRIEQVIDDDLAILAFLAAQADRVEEFRPLRLPMLAEEFARGITQELDLLSEAAYTHKFAEEFRDEPRLDVPTVFWDYCTERVLTMGRLEGVHVSRLLAGEGPPVDREAVARTLMDAYLKQVLVMGAFHADPHPGNILVTDKGKVALLDFGLVGHAGPRLRRDLGTCLMALGNGQPELVAEVAAEIGRLPDEGRADELREELVALLDRYSNIPLERLDFRRSFLDAMAVIRRYGVEVPRNLVLMSRALVAVSGIVMRLAPGLKLGELAAPYGRRLLRQKLSPSSVRRSLTSGSYHLRSLIMDGPREVRRIVRKLRQGTFELKVHHEGFERGLRELDQTGNRLSLSVILAAIIMASSTLLVAQIGAVNVFGWQVSLLGLLTLLFGLVLGVWLAVAIMRSGRI